MGSLHPYEQLLTFFLAFGPFALLALVVWLRRREDAAGDRAGDGAGEEAQRAERPESADRSEP